MQRPAMDPCRSRRFRGLVALTSMSGDLARAVQAIQRHFPKEARPMETAGLLPTQRRGSNH